MPVCLNLLGKGTQKVGFEGLGTHGGHLSSRGDRWEVNTRKLGVMRTTVEPQRECGYNENEKKALTGPLSGCGY